MKPLIVFAILLPVLAAAQDSAVVFNEIQYHPVNEAAQTEWIELKSLSGVDIDLSGWEISGGVNYTFPNGTVLAGRGFLLVAATPGQLSGALGPWTGNLSNAGEQLRLRNKNGRVMDAVEYRDDGDWPVGADGSGATLARRNQLSANDGPLAWAASNELGGTPGGSNFADAETAPRTTKPVPIDATWRYNDTNTPPPSNWADPAFVDTAWGTGQALLYAGTGKIAEPVPPTVTLSEPGTALYSWWAFEETSGTTAANGVGAGAAGTLTGVNTAFVADATRGRVVSVNQTATANATGSYVAAGSLPVLNMTNDFTWSFWSKTTTAAGTQVILGNRYSNATGTDFSPREFIKFTGLSFEFHRLATGEDVDYADMAGTFAAPGPWIHHAVVKQGAALSYYRNGVLSGSRSITAAPTNAQPLFMGGNGALESWSGWLDDVALWTRALPAQAVAGLAGGTYTPATAPTVATTSGGIAPPPAAIQFPVVTTTEMTDDFAAAGVDGAKWTVENLGLESTVDGGYNAPTTGGVLTLGGTSTFSYWAGKSLKSVPRFSSRAKITATVDRVSLTRGGPTGPIVRSSLWLMADAAHYVHFSQDYGETGWSYNSRDDGGAGTNNPTGGGVNLPLLDGFDNDAGNCQMKLVFTPGTYPGQGTIEMYRNGVLAGSQTVSNWPADFAVVLTGQARQATDVVTAVFDNLQVQKITPVPLQKQVTLGANTYYFRTAFTYGGDPSRTALTMYPIADDGVVYYLNGHEIYRQNMPGGAPSHGTAASAQVVDAYFPQTPVSIPTTYLIRGANVLAAEVHQDTPSSLDMLFGAQLQASEQPPPPADESPALVFNEISGAADANFRVEIANLSGATLNLAGYQIRSSSGGTHALSGSLAAGGLLTINAAALGFTPAGGDKLFLESTGIALADARTVTNALRGRTADGVWGHPNGATFGAANTFTVHDEIVINEIMYNAPGASPEKWVEIYNKSGGAVNIGGWHFTDGIDYTFPPATLLGAGEYALVVWDVAAFNVLHPGLPRVFGPFNSGLSGSGERIRFRDASDNLADEVNYRAEGRWPQFAGGGGSSLELKNPSADNAQPESWADSKETARGSWTPVSYTFLATNLETDATYYQEFIMGLVNDGEALIDDISVVEDPAGTAVELIQNGTFSGGTADKWRNIGNHRTSTVVDDPDAPGNKVLKIVATGYTEHMSNHCETTLSNGTTLPWTIVAAKNYRISYRARWLKGSNRLHTRLFFNRGARQELLPMPTIGGTPGAQNSVWVANAAPSFTGLTHFPVVPAASQPATVSVRIADSDGVSGATLYYAVNGGVFTPTPMTAAGGGLYTVNVPGQALSAKVQFYIQAQDTLGAVGTFPAAGANSRATIPWNDGLAMLTLPNGCKPHNVRIVMTTADATAMHALNNVMSNEYRPCTVIYDEREIYYHCGVHLKSSEHGRAKVPRVGFFLTFSPDQLFLGTHDTIAIDRSGAGDQFSQKEILVKHTLNRAGGIPCTQDDIIRVIAPQTVHTGPAMLVKTRLDSDSFLDGQFDNGTDGTLFEYELIYPLYSGAVSTSTDNGTWEGLKLTQDSPGPSGVSVRKLNPGATKEEYRWHWLIKNNRNKDDYSLLIPLLTEIGQPTSATFIANTNNVMDVSQWLRSWAGQIAWGVGDNYASGAQHNMLIYTRPGAKALYFPWDMDFTATSGATSSLTPNGDLTKLISGTPGAANKRLYYGHLLSICDNAFNTAYLSPWMAHYSCFLTESLSSFGTYVSQREAYIRAQVTAAVPATPFIITTNGGADYTEANPVTILAGNGWVDVANIRIAGNTALPVTWTGQSTWQITLPVGPGANVFSLEAVNSSGQIIGADSITVTGTNPIVPADATNLILTEINYNPGSGANPGREFLELLNISNDTLDLTGLRFVDGVQFDFPAALHLAPHARILVVDDTTLFAARYGGGLPVAGQFGPASALSNGGELLTLLDATGAIIFSTSYDDSPPATDGGGRSLTRLLSSTTPDIAAYEWRASCADGGTPGAAEANAFTGIATADADKDGFAALVEYAFGTSDNNAASFPPPVAFPLTLPTFSLTVDTAACPDDARIIPEVSTDLITWTLPAGLPAGYELHGDGTPQPGNLSRQTIGPLTYPDPGGRFYFRFRVQSR